MSVVTNERWWRVEMRRGVEGSDEGRRLPDECQECNLRIHECACDGAARCISARIDSDKDRAFWVSPGAIANCYPARATSCISEYLQRPAPSFRPSRQAFWDATRASRTTSNFGHVLSVDRYSSSLKQMTKASNIVCSHLLYLWPKVSIEKHTGNANKKIEIVNKVSLERKINILMVTLPFI